jgi:L-serine dehydratase
MERLSVFDIFKVGVGPSSSHTLGPWKAGGLFATELMEREPVTLQVHLHGSLSKTGKGHGTDLAVVMGLLGLRPESVDTSTIFAELDRVKATHELAIGPHRVYFDFREHIIYHTDFLPGHPNGLRFVAQLSDGSEFSQTYYSVGGGFLKRDHDADDPRVAIELPYPIDTGTELLAHTDATGRGIASIVYENELSFQPSTAIQAGIETIYRTMLECVYRGCHTNGILPGGLQVRRRAQALHDELLDHRDYSDCDAWLAAIRRTGRDFMNINKWVSCFALAVNEENAAFGRVVTSPTNGAAGVIPAVMLYHQCFGHCDQTDIRDFLLTAGEIGCLFKKGATISAAVGGCQAEIGVSSAMAAGGLTAVLGGSPRQVLAAAEIAMEHHLGLTCDPIAGLVQVPCIERNAMGAMKAITAAHLALSTDPEHCVVHFDSVVKTMWETAQDMHHQYKETAEAGLAKQVPVILADC